MALTLDHITVHDMELSDAIREYVEKKISKLAKFVDQTDESAAVDVELSKKVGDQNTGRIYMAKVALRSTMGDFYATGDGEDIYAAVDDVEEAITRELKKHNKKRMSLVRRGGRAFKEAIRQFRNRP